ncbi:MAG: hypothetical protein Q9217_004405 [Psora testacea]
MTLFAPPGLQMITTERFDQLTTNLDCKGDNGAMSIAFRSTDVLDHAWDSWKWINAKKEDRFLLIANNDGCGPDFERQPYLIHNVKRDMGSLAFHMTAEKVAWSEIAESYDLELGKASVTTPALQRRFSFGGFIDDISDAFEDAGDAVVDVVKDVVNGAEDVVEDVVEGAGDILEDVADIAEDTVDNILGGVDKFFGSLQKAGDKALDSVSNVAGGIGQQIKDVVGLLKGNIDLKKGVKFPLNLGKPGKNTPLFRDSSRSFNLDCIDCYVAGSLVLTGEISVRHFTLRTFTLNTHPQNLHTTMELEARVSGSSKRKFFESKKELFSAPIPGAGIAVPGVFKLGLVAAYNVGFTAAASGKANIDFGFKAALPDTAGITLDLKKPSASSARGFQGATFEPIFEVEQLTSDLTVTARSETELTFGIEIVKVAQFDLALKLNAPELIVAAKAGRNNAGYCSKGPGASKTGAKVTSSVGVSMDFELEKSLFGQKSKPLFDVNLFRVTKPIFSKCFPIKI